MKVKSLTHVQLLVTPWTAAHQAPLSMGFSRQDCWCGVPLPSPTTCPISLQNRGRALQHPLSAGDSQGPGIRRPAPRPKCRVVGAAPWGSLDQGVVMPSCALRGQDRKTRGSLPPADGHRAQHQESGGGQRMRRGGTRGRVKSLGRETLAGMTCVLYGLRGATVQPSGFTSPEP